MCTTELSPHQHIVFNPKYDLPSYLQTGLNKLEIQVLLILEVAIKFGITFIITNAAQGWVELSSKRFMPKVFELIKKHEIKIISARTMYEKEFPHQY